ncbi:hypothetical protein CCAX7_54210 [Capsulimonas corticalis]|uniref:Uncharacterized protein n=1 Tax=Capsulimonas corticalis TaxID=2219043 RepID=A0A402CNE3_9BACT|nr:hypothetical protein [Capsulimonas corticalis]BDI33370.1 hypothetical protein CCAX7_54210 [Capsulimonas corticalis]
MNNTEFRTGDVAVTPSGLQLEVKEIHPFTGNGQFLALEPLPGQRMEKNLYSWCPAYDYRKLEPGEKVKKAPARGLADMEPPAYQEY